MTLVILFLNSLSYTNVLEVLIFSFNKDNPSFNSVLLYINSSFIFGKIMNKFCSKSLRYIKLSVKFISFILISEIPSIVNSPPDKIKRFLFFSCWNSIYIRSPYFIFSWVSFSFLSFSLFSLFSSVISLIFLI